MRTAENPGGIAYGAILVGALLAAESGHPETYKEAIASGLIGAVVFWLLHAYASALGRRVARQERLTVGVLMRSLAEEWTIIPGAAIPLLTIVIAGLAGASLEKAVTDRHLGLRWSSIIVLEVGAGINAGARGTELVLDATVGRRPRRRDPGPESDPQLTGARRALEHRAAGFPWQPGARQRRRQRRVACPPSAPCPPARSTPGTRVVRPGSPSACPAAVRRSSTTRSSAPAVHTRSAEKRMSAIASAKVSK